MSKMISVPESILKKISKASRAFQDLEDELEDSLLVSDRDFLAKMRRSRKAHMESETRPFEALKKEICID